MKILVFGAGVIGVTYAWQLSLAGHEVALLVRPGRKQEMESKGIAISCLDNRGGLLFLGGGKKHTTTVCGARCPHSQRRHDMKCPHGLMKK